MARKNPFEPSKSATAKFARALKRIAQAASDIAEGYLDDGPAGIAPMKEALASYARQVEPWARKVVAAFTSAVITKNDSQLKSISPKIAQTMRENKALFDYKTEAIINQLRAEQVSLITSLPLTLAEKAQQSAVELFNSGMRPDALKDEIIALRQTSIGRAKLIARTETAKASSYLTEARSVAAGSDSYIWETAGDEAVRDSHAEMQGTVHRWDSPPTLSDGTTTHPGQIWNCRCFSNPIFTNLE